MRVLWEIFTVVMALGVLFAISKGFPAFGRVVGFLLLNPIGLIAVAGLIVWLITLRNRAIARRTTSSSQR